MFCAIMRCLTPHYGCLDNHCTICVCQNCTRSRLYCHCVSVLGCFVDGGQLYTKVHWPPAPTNQSQLSLHAHYSEEHAKIWRLHLQSLDGPTISASFPTTHCRHSAFSVYVCDVIEQSEPRFWIGLSTSGFIFERYAKCFGMQALTFD